MDWRLVCFVSLSLELLDFETIIPPRIAPCAPQRPSSQGVLRRRRCRGPRKPAAREREEEEIRAPSFLLHSNDGLRRNRRRKLFFFFFPSTGTTRAERERERDTKIKRQRGSDPSFSLRALLRSLCTPMSLTTIDKKERRRARKKRVASKKRAKSEQSSPRKKVERRNSLSLVSRERLLSFILSLSTALPFQHHVGASCPAAVPRSGGRVQR